MIFLDRTYTGETRNIFREKYMCWAVGYFERSLQSQFVRDRHIPASTDETSTGKKGGVSHGLRAFSEENQIILEGVGGQFY